MTRILTTVLLILCIVSITAPLQAGKNTKQTIRFSTERPLRYELELHSYYQQSMAGSSETFEDWTVLLSVTMQCKKVYRNEIFDLVADLQVKKLSMQDTDGLSILAYQRGGLDEKAKRQRSVLSGLEAMPIVKVKIRMRSDGTVMKVSAIQPGLRALSARIPDSSEAGRAVHSMLKRVFHISALRDVLAMSYAPFQSAWTEGMDVPLVWKSGLFPYPWQSFPLRYMTPKKELRNKRKCLSVSAMLCKRKKKGGRLFQALEPGDQLSGEAALFYDPSESVVVTHTIQWSFDRVRSIETGITSRETGRFSLSWQLLK